MPMGNDEFVGAEIEEYLLDERAAGRHEAKVVDEAVQLQVGGTVVGHPRAQRRHRQPIPTATRGSPSSPPFFAAVDGRLRPCLR